MNSTNHPQPQRKSAPTTSQSGVSFVQSFARQPARPSMTGTSTVQRGIPSAKAPVSNPDHSHTTALPDHKPSVEPWVESDDVAKVAIKDPGHSRPSRSHLPPLETSEQHSAPPKPVAPVSPMPTAQEIQPIVPVWEVDVFDVPTTVADLFFAGKLFGDLGVRMSEAATGGLQSIMVTSTESGEGRSSVAIGMALAAASTGMKVALVDADVQNPTLVDDLRLDVEFGWIESIRSGLPLSEVAIHAIEDGVTLIPLLAASDNEAGPAETIQLIERLQSHFDMVIIDGPPSDSLPLYRVAPVVDSALVVRDVTRVSADAINAFALRLRDAGVKGVGVVENFTGETN